MGIMSNACTLTRYLAKPTSSGLMDSFARSGADRVTVQVEGEEPVTLYERAKEEA